MARMLYFVAYDVRQPSRLRATLNVLKDYASGGQKSAFECYLTPAEHKALLERIRAVLNPEVDAFVMTRIPDRKAAATLGKALRPLDEFCIYFG